MIHALGTEPRGLLDALNARTVHRLTPSVTHLRVWRVYAVSVQVTDEGVTLVRTLVATLHNEAAAHLLVDVLRIRTDDRADAFEVIEAAGGGGATWREIESTSEIYTHTPDAAESYATRYALHQVLADTGHTNVTVSVITEGEDGVSKRLIDVALDPASTTDSLLSALGLPTHTSVQDLARRLCDITCA